MSVSLSLPAFASLNNLSMANYKFDYYGTNDQSGSFAVSIDGADDVQNKATKQGRTLTALMKESDSRSSSNTIKYNFDMNAGDIITYALDGDGQKDNSFVIFDRGGRLIGYTSKLEAVDKSGKTIDTDISVQNNTIYQTFKDSEKESAVVNFEIYPLQNSSARAEAFTKYFKKGEWIQRDMTSLSLTVIYAFPTNSTLYAAWDTVVNKYGRDSRFYNEAGMKDQFHCHNDFASNKRPWNLEPARPNVGYAATVAAKCNPQ